MEKSIHQLPDLFAQLGLAADAESITRFIRTHAPLADHLRLAEAPFWNPSQAAFLREEIAEDADWAEVVDQLDAALRSSS
ncbi:hypothetical protein CJ010_08700 [Azoarcus sp. DD4]|uniref:DUF2789 domain-containing protein n=1 Tax=Azoarcus sp. DD4 TaxID=2027405 RepID=UPI00112CF070|nr:DUF2789 domain-containing protein [Azoarcus sp. DD4]QDF96606.1 hypothetical protein CJ010_08700 [Azoarcus sp. DD4]